MMNVTNVMSLLRNISFFIILNTNFYFAQTKVYGTVKNATGAAYSANIFVKDNLSNSIKVRTYSNKEGNYEVIIQETGDFNLVIMSLGFETRIIPLKIISGKHEQRIDIVLKEKIQEIDEVIINKKRPILAKKDTISFRTKYFTDGTELTVEDLLKKIPGLQIDSEGTVKIGEKEIEKLMIDGDDLFEKGYKILSKNMPAYPIEEVELLKNYSNNPLLKGIENSDKVAINLKLNENSKRVWFGNIIGGYNVLSESRYETKGNLMNFGKKNKYYFLANLNNIGDNATGDINYLIRPYRFNDPGSIGDDQTANSLLGLGFDTPDLKQKRVNFNNAEMLSLNSILTLSPKTKLKLLGFFNSDENDFYKYNFQSFNIGDTSFENTENFVGRKKTLTGFGKVDLTHDFSKNKTLEYSGKINLTELKSRSNVLFNDEPINENLHTNNQLFDQKIVYTNKIKENKVLLLSGRYINEKTPQNYATNHFLFSDLFSENANNTKQYSQNHMQFLGVEAHLLNRIKNGDLFEMKLGSQLRIDDLDTQLELLNDNTSLSFPNNSQNNITYSTNDLYLSAKYRWKFGKYALLTQTSLHQLFNQSENFNTKTKQNPFFVVPKIGLDWEINEKNKIIASYTYNTTNAEILDIYPNFIQTGFRSLSKGLDDFNQLNSSNFVLNYTYGSWSDNFFANTFMVYSKNNDFYSTNSIIKQDYSTSEKIIIKDREFFSVTSNIDRYLKPIKSNLKLNVSFTKSNYKNIVNNSDLREVKSTGVIYGLELRSGFKGFFNYHIGTKWNYNQIKTSIKNSYTDNMSFLDLSFMFNDRFNIQVQSERYLFGNLDKGNNQYYFLDAEARYTIKENKLTLSLVGNNLFNTKTFRNYNISDISISKTEYRLQPRYLMLKAEYRF